MRDEGELRIERLLLILPAGMEGRAHGLGRLLTQQLAALPLPPGNLSLPGLELGTRAFDAGQSDLALAQGMARALAARLAESAPMASGLSEGSASGAVAYRGGPHA